MYSPPAPFLPQTSQQNPKQLYFMLPDSFCALLLRLRPTYVFINHDCLCISISIHWGHQEEEYCIGVQSFHGTCHTAFYWVMNKVQRASTLHIVLWGMSYQVTNRIWESCLVGGEYLSTTSPFLCEKFPLVVALLGFFIPSLLPQEECLF